ncbi:hypothetical protein ACSQ67_023856 [Phaseolus vulgaris]
MDPSFDILTHNKSCFLLDEDKARLAIYDEDRLRHYSKKLLGQAISRRSWMMSRRRIKKILKTRRLDKLPNSNGRLSTSVPRSPRLASKTQEGLVLSKEKNGLSKGDNPRVSPTLGFG